MVFMFSYNPDSNNIKNHRSVLSMSSDIYSSQYRRYILLADFNVEMKNWDSK